jgi:hypothetical protein
MMNDHDRETDEMQPTSGIKIGTEGIERIRQDQVDLIRKGERAAAQLTHVRVLMFPLFCAIAGSSIPEPEKTEVLRNINLAKDIFKWCDEQVEKSLSADVILGAVL